MNNVIRHISFMVCKNTRRKTLSNRRMIYCILRFVHRAKRKKGSEYTSNTVVLASCFMETFYFGPAGGGGRPSIV